MVSWKLIDHFEWGHLVSKIIFKIFKSYNTLGVWPYPLTSIYHRNMILSHIWPTIRSQYDISHMAPTVGMEQSVTARYAETCDQEHCTLVTTNTTMGDINGCVISNMFLHCKCEMYSGLRESPWVTVCLFVCIMYRIVSLFENMHCDLHH